MPCIDGPSPQRTAFGIFDRHGQHPFFARPRYIQHAVVAKANHRSRFAVGVGLIFVIIAPTGQWAHR